MTKAFMLVPFFASLHQPTYAYRPLYTRLWEDLKSHMENIVYSFPMRKYTTVRSRNHHSKPLFRHSWITMCSRQSEQERFFGKDSNYWYLFRSPLCLTPHCLWQFASGLGVGEGCAACGGTTLPPPQTRWTAPSGGASLIIYINDHRQKKQTFYF